MSTYPKNMQLHTCYADNVYAAESSTYPHIDATALAANAEAIQHWIWNETFKSLYKNHMVLFLPLNIEITTLKQ